MVGVATVTEASDVVQFCVEPVVAPFVEATAVGKVVPPRPLSLLVEAEREFAWPGSPLGFRTTTGSCELAKDRISSALAALSLYQAP